MTRLLVVATALAALAAGCLQAPSSPPATDEEEWYLGGAFTTERTAEDIEAVCRAGSGNRTCAIMESWPEQFGFRFTSEPACLVARGKIAQVPHVTVRNCVQLGATPIDAEEPVASTPPPRPTGDRAATYDVRTFEVTWSDGAGRENDVEWEVVAAYLADGVITVNTTTHGIEGGDFRFTLWLAPAGPSGGVHFFEPGAPERGTFDFDYREEPYWAGRFIDRVEHVDPSSYVRVVRADERGLLEGTFHLDFTGSGEGAPRDAATHRTILDGRFGV